MHPGNGIATCMRLVLPFLAAASGRFCSSSSVASVSATCVVRFWMGVVNLRGASSCLLQAQQLPMHARVAAILFYQLPVSRRMRERSVESWTVSPWRQAHVSKTRSLRSKRMRNTAGFGTTVAPVLVALLFEACVVLLFLRCSTARLGVPMCWFANVLDG